ncbi:glycosyltransferase family 4 protein [Acinetobacter towneri]|uniref:glycosyltransferase family 4 protein n=1 Tax=Acinetobacter towneri TaxID=202956 RepID=UPI002B260681|nr:glycosyltransferase family 4 protein [Acinetobacter towneri]WPC32134.1 glycosyltransferase family 4 protein [Acinetobacter towneri]
MKNICFLVGNLNNPGGTERVATSIANQLLKENFNIFILSFYEGLNPFFKLEDGVLIDNLYPNKKSFFNSFFNMVIKIRKYIIKNKIDTLIVVDSISCIFTVPALIGLKVNHICWEQFNYNVNLGVVYRKWGRILAAKYCNYIVTLTERDKVLWKKNIGKEKIRAKIITIPNSNPYINLDNLSSYKRTKTVLAVGRLTHQKGFDILLKAWAEFCKMNQDWSLNIIGNGEDEKNLKILANSLNISSRVVFIPATKDIDFYYKKSSIFCLSSRYEGFGMVILEAQAFGLPVVSFDCDCGPSDLITHEENGYLVPNNDEIALSKNLLKLVSCSEENYSKLSKNSFLNAQKFNIDKLIGLWLGIL